MDLLIVGVGLLRDKIAEFKSPIIPLPQIDTALRDPESARIPVILSERTLYERHREWKMRSISLWIRQTALIEAKARGFDSCWAGPVDRKTIRATRAAIVEAKWVEKRLGEALEWTEERRKSNVPLKKIVVVSKSGRKSRPRQSHTEFPLVLLELPFPIPPAPASRNLRLTIPMPPSIEENVEGQPPPLYTPDLDEKSGEMRLENVRWDPVRVEEVES
ncbi:uncharacterized protein JCM6883_000922 [Sporobolomyces salmoneus]|uniref:uncharacterized protein n=1 Tax=Sporobolomyces salmoneus TaxID=183962 RepID=UPI0031740369